MANYGAGEVKFNVDTKLRVAQRNLQLNLNHKYH